MLIGKAVKKTAAAKGISIGLAKVELLKACESGIIRARWSGYRLGGSPLIPRQEFRDADIDIEKDALILGNGERKGDASLDDDDFAAWLADQANSQAEAEPADDQMGTLPAGKPAEPQHHRRRTKIVQDAAEQRLLSEFPESRGVPPENLRPKDIIERVNKGLSPGKQFLRDTVRRAVKNLKKKPEQNQ